eukprot:6202152-Pleurochrysis_carterae.AAC.3
MHLTDGCGSLQRALMSARVGRVQEGAEPGEATDPAMFGQVSVCGMTRLARHVVDVVHTSAEDVPRRIGAVVEQDAKHAAVAARGRQLESRQHPVTARSSVKRVPNLRIERANKIRVVLIP